MVSDVRGPTLIFLVSSIIIDVSTRKSQSHTFCIPYYRLCTRRSGARLPLCLLLIRRKMARLSQYEERINVLYLITKLLMLIDCRFRVHYQITRRSVQVDLTFQRTQRRWPKVLQIHSNIGLVYLIARYLLHTH